MSRPSNAVKRHQFNNCNCVLCPLCHARDAPLWCADRRCITAIVCTLSYDIPPVPPSCLLPFSFPLLRHLITNPFWPEQWSPFSPPVLGCGVWEGRWWWGRRVGRSVWGGRWRGAAFVQPSLSFTLSPAPFNFLCFLSLPAAANFYVYLFGRLLSAFVLRKVQVFQLPAFLFFSPWTKLFKSWRKGQQVAYLSRTWCFLSKDNW